MLVGAGLKSGSDGFELGGVRLGREPLGKLHLDLGQPLVELGIADGPCFELGDCRRSSASDRACSSRAAVDPASSASTAGALECDQRFVKRDDLVWRDDVLDRAASASRRPSIAVGSTTAVRRARPRAPRSRPVTRGSSASSVSPRRSTRATSASDRRSRSGRQQVDLRVSQLQRRSPRSGRRDLRPASPSPRPGSRREPRARPGSRPPGLHQDARQVPLRRL